MTPEASADTAVLASAILTLLAIASKLITANLLTRNKRTYTKLDVRRRDIGSRLKEVQLKRNSAKGTLEFWERRRAETSQKVLDAQRDVENYEAMFAAEDGVERDAAAPTGDDADDGLLDDGLLTDPATESDTELSATDGDAETAEVPSADQDPPAIGEEGDDAAEPSGEARDDKPA